MTKIWRVYVNAGGSLQHWHSDVVLPHYPSYEIAVEDLKAHFKIKSKIIRSGEYEFVILPSFVVKVI